MPKTLRGSFEQALRPPPSVVKGVQACRLPGLKRSAAASTRHSGHCPLLLGAVTEKTKQPPKLSLSACLSLSVSLPACLSACLSFCLPACLSVCLSVCLCLCQCRSVSINAACLPACTGSAQACRLPGLKCQLKKCAARQLLEQALRPLPSVDERAKTSSFGCHPMPGLKCLNTLRGSWQEQGCSHHTATALWTLTLLRAFKQSKWHPR